MVFDEYGVYGARYRRFGMKVKTVKTLEKGIRGYHNASRTGFGSDS